MGLGVAMVFSQSQGFAMGSCKKHQSIDGFLQKASKHRWAFAKSADGKMQILTAKLEWTHAREHRSPGHNRHAKQHAEASEQAELPM
jgi:hypothetical protein